MIPPRLRQMLAVVAGKRPPGPLQLSAALVGGWTEGELLAFGFRRMPDGKWLAPPEWNKA